MNTRHPVTQIELAKQIGISQGYLSRILAKKQRPSLEVAEVLAKIRDVHVLHVLSPDRYDESGRPTPTEAA